jgi:hypothetical protein
MNNMFDGIWPIEESRQRVAALQIAIESGVRCRCEFPLSKRCDDIGVLVLECYNSNDVKSQCNH